MTVRLNISCARACLDGGLGAAWPATCGTAKGAEPEPVLVTSLGMGGRLGGTSCSCSGSSLIASGYRSSTGGDSIDLRWTLALADFPLNARNADLAFFESSELDAAAGGTPVAPEGVTSGFFWTGGAEEAGDLTAQSPLAVVEGGRTTGCMPATLPAVEEGIAYGIPEGTTERTA